MRCLECGSEFVARRKDHRYCSAKCRVYASRAARKARLQTEAEEAAKLAERTLKYESWLRQLSGYNPKIAEKYKDLIELVGLDCAEPAVRLALQAYYEGKTGR